MKYIIVDIMGTYKGLKKKTIESRNGDPFDIYLLTLEKGYEEIYEIKIKEEDIDKIKNNITAGTTVLAKCFLNSRNTYLSLSLCELIAGFHYDRAKRTG